MPRKRFASDLNTTTLRVKKLVARKLRKVARREKLTVFAATDNILTAALVSE